MQFKKGFTSMAVVLWDTAWTPEVKAEKLRGMDSGTRVEILGWMVVNRAKPDVAPDLDLSLRTAMAALGGWQRGDLHKLRTVVAEQDLPAVDKAIRASIRPSDTGGSPPQKKTPSGMTRVINMNYRLNEGNRSDLQFQHAQFFAEQARNLDLRLCILTTANAQQDLQSSDVLNGLEVRWSIADEVASEWAEDSVEFLQSGTVAVLDQFTDSALRAGLVDGRRARWHGLVDQAYEAEVFHPINSKEWVAEGLLVNAGRTRQTRTDALAKQHSTIAHLRCYTEGGNLIVGEDASGRTVVLVGRDSIAATRAEYLSTDDKAVVALIAEDFGLVPDQVILVEQPGKFHLDMGLLFLGNGLVVVNNSSDELAAAQARLLRFDTPSNRKLIARLVLQCGLENLAAQDLGAAGLKVLRQALESGENCNYFNGEFVADADGRVHYLTNGAAEAKKDITTFFMNLLVDELKIAVAVHRTSAAAAEQSLKVKGGVGCRIKGAPTIG
jgi:hypothetical protein